MGSIFQFCNFIGHGSRFCSSTLFSIGIVILHRGAGEKYNRHCQAEGWAFFPLKRAWLMWRQKIPQQSPITPPLIWGCYFGGKKYELDEEWNPDLGPPFGIMVCIRGKCIPSTK
ncbi:chordin [Trichinella spiralis]|uniref:chordin n=1 Tax=Trichinella spiralis TaxID=6334 RepID=UPI0001EFD25B|nr:chordin [Trichinella spiralis]